MQLTPRPYQVECFETFKERIDKVQRGGLIVLPTGTGKSLTMADIAKWWLANRKGGVGIASHRIELVKQNANEFDEHFGKKGACYRELGNEYRMSPEDWDNVRRGGVVSFTIQTLQNNRMRKAGADALGLILVDECFTGDTEILTSNGFVRFDELKKGVKVAQYDSGVITFVNPTDYVCNYRHGDMIRIYSDRLCDLVMTPGHELLLKSGTETYKQPVSDACLGTALKSMFVAGKAVAMARSLSPWERLMIATQADGSNHSKGVSTPFSSVAFSFSKERKISRFIKLMEDGNFDWSEVKGDSHRRANAKARRRFIVKSLHGVSKNLWEHFDISTMDSSFAAEIIEEMTEWDGYRESRRPKARYFSSCVKSQSDFFQAVALIAGYKTNMAVQHDDRSDNFSSVYRVFAETDKDSISCQAIKKEVINFCGKVYCVRVPSGNIVVRRNGKPLVIGNCHRIKDKGQYNKTRDYFGCKWVGLTATPDRTDGQGLVPNMFDECWYGHKEGQLINDFVEQGWLTPPRIQHVHVRKLQWQWLKGRSGKDFTNEQVSKVWSDYESIHEFVAPILKEVGNKKTLYFCPGVQQAKGVVDVINSIADPKRIAEYVASYKIDEDGAKSMFDKYARRSIIKRFGRIDDELQHVANMGVFVEGTNVPIISAIGWLRFTKSRLLLAQGAGRAFRTWPGILNGLENATAAERRAAIANSPKPFALIFDPTRRSGTKLRLAHLIDIFNTTRDADVQAQIERIIKHKTKREEVYDPREVLEEAKHLESPFFKGLRAALLEIAPTVDYRLVEVDPYRGDSLSDWSRKKPEPKVKTIGDATPAQKNKVKYLSTTKYSDDFYLALTKKQAGAIIGQKLKEPPVQWMVDKILKAKLAVPKTNAEALALIKSLPGGR